MGDDAPRQQGLFHIGLEKRGREILLWRIELFAGLARRLHGRPHPRIHRRLDGGRRFAELQRLDHRPAAGALLAGAVVDHIDDPFARFGIACLQDLRGDLDQIGLQRALVPGLEKPADRIGRAFLAIAQDAVDLGDHLHVGIFDAVMHGFHEMPGAIGAHQRRAGLAVEPRGNGLDHIADGIPGALRSAGHDRGAVARAFRPARNPHADQINAPFSQGAGAAAGIVIIGIARIDDDVALFQMWHKRLYLLIHRPSGLDHQNDGAGFFKCRNKASDILARHEICGQIPGLFHQGMDPPGRAVVDGNAKALLGDIERQIGPHHPKADQPDTCQVLFFSHAMPSNSCRKLKGILFACKQDAHLPRQCGRSFHHWSGKYPRRRQEISAPALPHARGQTPRHQRITAFCACRRFSASSKITERGPSITALVTSSSRWAGRQCMKSASGPAFSMSASFT